MEGLVDWQLEAFNFTKKGFVGFCLWSFVGLLSLVLSLVA
jgi:hypothetical protein